ncbi:MULTISPECIES: hypothetical protein [Flavobacterium]|uniref:Uncharacterized protein n=1 Tax=Flavobacterium algoritolerans TaxID=3041254 RepID=A0ABT6VCZ6_9FLAO|nr:hypothetical protein [Flavobacterium algoritolerans]MDI5895353.1 hypothetical protein [Flavobacterium algoritolerans]
MEKVTLTRKELHNLVWKETMSALSKKYAISDNGFRKLCIRMNIPIPRNGYWQKINFNKSVIIDKLPIEFEGEDKIQLEIRKEGSEVNLDQSPVTILTKQILEDKNAPLIVSQTLDNPDKLIVATKNYFSNKKKKNWDYKRGDNILSISVEPENEGRALCFMDALIKLIQYRGHSIKVINNDTLTIINGTEIPIYLRETKKRVFDRSTGYGDQYKYIPNGVFALKTGKWSGDKEWRDGKLKLEDQIGKILAKLEIDAQEIKIKEEESRLWRLKYDEELRIKQELEKRKQIELTNFKFLLANAERLDKVTKLRNYIKTVEDNAVVNNYDDPELRNWINWAKDKIDWYDPLVRKEDELLNDKDIKELEEKKTNTNYYR